VPDPVNYRKDLWDEVGVRPDTWDAIREGGRRIKEKHGIPVGIGMSNELDSSMALRSILLAFGAGVQDADGRPSLKSKNTLEALRYGKALFTDAMTDEIFSWDASSNNRQMLAGKGSLTLNAISVTRTGENEKIPVASRIALGRPARGPVAAVGVMHLMNAYAIWKFARNIDGAKKFLVDLAGASRNAFLASSTTSPRIRNWCPICSNSSRATPRRSRPTSTPSSPMPTSGRSGWVTPAMPTAPSTRSGRPGWYRRCSPMSLPAG
jgi:multiple sugar transport system substrate-binding protein